jgi:cullin-associated NEDD8-dissociated protein 1
LQAFESFVLRCPHEISTQLDSILQCSQAFITYDPNYTAEDGASDDEMDTGDDDGDGDGDGSDDEAYSDDDDISWKVRSAAVKCIDAIISTRPESLPTLKQQVNHGRNGSPDPLVPAATARLIRLYQP